MSAEQITIESLTEQGKEILQGISFVQPSPNVIRLFSVYRLENDSIYERWKNVAIRFLSSKYPNDESVTDFRKAAEKFEKDHYSPTEMKKMIGILESITIIPTQLNHMCNQQSKQPSIIINNTNSQSQSQTIDVDWLSKAIEDVLTISQIKELNKVFEDEGGNMAKAKPKLVEKLKSFGENIASNIVANIITSPSIWTSLFN